MHNLFKSLCIASLTMAAAASVPGRAEAAAGVDGFIWDQGVFQAVGATVEAVNTQTGKVAWRGTANRSNPSFSGLGNYFVSPTLPAGRYLVRANYRNKAGSTCCAILNQSIYPNGFYSRMNVNVR